MCMQGWHVAELALDRKTSNAFVHVFKNAGTALGQAVVEHGGSLQDIWTAADPHAMERHLTAILSQPSWFRSAFVRDPVERVLSAYHEKKKQESISKVRLEGERRVETMEGQLSEFRNLIKKIIWWPWLYKHGCSQYFYQNYPPFSQIM